MYRDVLLVAQYLPWLEGTRECVLSVLLRYKSVIQLMSGRALTQVMELVSVLANPLTDAW